MFFYSSGLGTALSHRRGTATTLRLWPFCLRRTLERRAAAATSTPVESSATSSKIIWCKSWVWSPWRSRLVLVLRTFATRKWKCWRRWSPLPWRMWCLGNTSAIRTEKVNDFGERCFVIKKGVKFLEVYSVHVGASVCTYKSNSIRFLITL